MKNFVGLALAAALIVSTSAAFADSCKDGTAPAGWLRDGGYCSIVNSTKDHQNPGEGVSKPSFWSTYTGTWKDFPAWKDAN